jgi:ribosomal protein S18 acetylase RimI-like enzyme
VSPAATTTIRPARPGDAETVLEIWAATGLYPSVSDDAEYVRAILAHDPTALLVAEVDGRVVGTLIAGFDGWRGNMYRLAVLPEHRRRGIARALVEEGERLLREKGAARAAAIVILSKRRAVEFWEAAGYGSQADAGRFVKTL